MVEFVDAWHEAIWYAGYDQIIVSWAELPTNDYGHIDCPLEFDCDDIMFLIWSIFVLMYGNYGTSPRYGWIEHVSEFRDFINTKFVEVFNI